MDNSKLKMITLKIICYLDIRYLIRHISGYTFQFNSSTTTKTRRSKLKPINNISAAVSRVEFELGIEKKNNQPSSVFPTLYREFYRLFIAISIDHWQPRILFVLLIN